MGGRRLGSGRPAIVLEPQCITRVGFRILLLGALSACAGNSFTTDLPPGAFTPDTTVAMFGVFHAGRMEPSAWPRLKPAVVGALATSDCPMYYDDGLSKTNSDAFERIYTEAKEEGDQRQLD